MIFIEEVILIQWPRNGFLNTLPNANTTLLHTNQYSQTNPNWKTYSFRLWRPNRANIIVDHILQPIAKSQRYHRICYPFIEEKKVPEDAILVSMDVTSLYTNIPQEEEINTVRQAYDIIRKSFMRTPLPFLSIHSEICLNWYCWKTPFSLMGGTTSRLTEPRWRGSRVAVASANIFMSRIET